MQRSPPNTLYNESKTNGRQTRSRTLKTLHRQQTIAGIQLCMLISKDEAMVSPENSQVIVGK